MLNVIIDPDSGAFLGFSFSLALENEALIAGYHVQSISYDEAAKFLKFFQERD